MRHLIAGFVALLTLAPASPASAATFSGSADFSPGTITSGQSVTAQILLNLDAGSGNYLFDSRDLDLSVNWGDGSTSGYFQFAPPFQPDIPLPLTQTDTLSFQFTHTYSFAGLYFPSVFVTDSFGYFNGFPSGPSIPQNCTDASCLGIPLQISGLPLFPVFNAPFLDVTQPPPATTPIPPALPLFVSGLGVLGFLGWSVKRRMAQPAALA